MGAYKPLGQPEKKKGGALGKICIFLIGLIVLLFAVKGVFDVFNINILKINSFTISDVFRGDSQDKEIKYLDFYYNRLTQSDMKNVNIHENNIIRHSIETITIQDINSLLAAINSVYPYVANEGTISWKSVINILDNPNYCILYKDLSANGATMSLYNDYLDAYPFRLSFLEVPTKDNTETVDNVSTDLKKEDKYGDYINSIADGIDYTVYPAQSFSIPVYDTDVHIEIVTIDGDIIYDRVKHIDYDSFVKQDGKYFTIFCIDKETYDKARQAKAAKLRVSVNYNKGYKSDVQYQELFFIREVELPDDNAQKSN